MMDLIHKNLTDKILNAFYTVYNELGYGFLEKVYENALCIELENQGLSCQKQKPIHVFYKDKLVGEYFTDIMVENRVIIELKAVENIAKEHEYQLINYLKCSKIEIGLLLNFGKKPEFKRKISTK
jgi:GxxExxY protein